MSDDNVRELPGRPRARRRHPSAPRPAPEPQGVEALVRSAPELARLPSLYQAPIIAAARACDTGAGAGDGRALAAGARALVEAIAAAGVDPPGAARGDGADAIAAITGRRPRR